MADWVEDDWDSCSPIGSPSSSLPQSIREVLDSVRAECNAGAFGAFCSSNVDKPATAVETNVPHEQQPLSHDEQRTEFDDMKEMLIESHGQMQVNVNEQQEVSRMGPRLIASQVRALEETKKSSHDLTEASNFDACKEVLIFPQQNVAEDQKKKTEDVPEIENAQSRVGDSMELKPTYEHVVCGNKKEVQAQQEDLLRSKREHPNVNRILAGYQNTKFSWIKIGRPSKKLSPEKVQLATEFHQSKIHGSEPLPTVNPKEIKSTGALGLKVQMEVRNAIMKQDDLKRKASTEHAGATRVTKMVGINSRKEPILEDHLHLTKPISETKMTQPIDLTDNPESPGLIEESTKRQKVDKSSMACSRLEYGVDKVWATENAKMTENETQSLDQSQELFLEQNRVTAVHPGKIFDPSMDEDQPQKRVQVNTCYIDLTDDLESSENQSLEMGVNQKDEKRTFEDLEEKESKGMDGISKDDLAVLERNIILNEEPIECNMYQKQLSPGDSQTSMKVQESQTYGLPEVQKENNQLSDFKAGALRYSKDYQGDKTLIWRESDVESEESSASSQNKMDLDRADVETQINHKVLKREEPIKGETLHNQLKEKYLNMNFSKEVSPIRKEYQEFKPLYEEIEEFARACDDSPVMDVKNIKMKLFNDDEQQAIHRSVIHGSASTGKTKAEFDRESKKHSVMIWRQELLSSDFNLIYGSLRAVLMGNLSKDDRHRLIQTMIATMGEIEEVTMGEGKPTPQSVRCETPELTTGVDEAEEGKKESDSGENEEIKTETEPPELQAFEEELIRIEVAPRDKAALRDREAVLNVRRIEKLMKKRPDGTLTCLVCKKRGLPGGRACRACSAFAYRVERNYTIGIPIPTCSHTNYSGGFKCKSCRFRKFSFLSMTATDTRVREVNPKVCPICKRSTYFSRGWKCGKCYYFLLKLLRNKRGQMPTCKHSGEFPHSCDGCRCYNLQVEWANHETDRVYPLPIIQKNRIKRKT